MLDSLIPLINDDNFSIDSLTGNIGKLEIFRKIMKDKLREGIDYGKIANFSKPTLYKAGAETIILVLGLSSSYEILSHIEDFNKGIFAYMVKCSLFNKGAKIAEGYGSCNSKEEKYRYKWVYDSDIPFGIDKENLKSKKNNYGRMIYRVDNDETFSVANTLLKMAKKRAQIDAALTVSGLSDKFTQDIEDLTEVFKDMENSTPQIFVNAKSCLDDISSDIPPEADKSENDTPALLNVKFTYGKYKNKTIGDILKTDKQYIGWFSQNGGTKAIRDACIKVLEELKNKGKANENKDITDITDITDEDLNKELDIKIEKVEF